MAKNIMPIKTCINTKLQQNQSFGDRISIKEGKLKALSKWQCSALTPQIDKLKSEIKDVRSERGKIYQKKNPVNSKSYVMPLTRVSKFVVKRHKVSPSGCKASLPK